MIQFDEPIYFYLLLVIPVLLVLYLAHHIWKKRTQRRFADPRLLRRLAPDRSLFKPQLKLLLFLLGLAFLILGNELLGLPCGGGVLHVDPFQSWVIQGSPGTVSAVEKLVPLSIPDDPALAGASLHAQWATKHAAGPCPLFGVELSNALRFTVQ